MFGPLFSWKGTLSNSSRVPHRAGVLLRAIALLAVVLAVTSGLASASGYTVKFFGAASGGTPFTSGCNGAPQSGTNYPGTEVEPYVAVNPTNSQNVIGVYQQDRWSSGGSNGLVTSFSNDGGKHWSQRVPHFSRCSGGNATNGGDYERATDPWVTFAPNGDAYQISDSFNDSNPVTAILVSKSTDGGATWSEPTTLLRSSGLRDSAYAFNDKESITADPTNSNYVYAIWDQLVSPNTGSRASYSGYEHARTYRGPTWFSRTTDGGQTWEPARIIYDPGQTNQTIGNQIVVLPDGTLVDVFTLISNYANPQGTRGLNVAIIRSTDKGLTWSQPVIVSNELSIGVPGVRTGDIIPEIAVNPANGNLYTVWQDSRFSNGAHDDVAFSMSTNGGSTWSQPVKINRSPANIAAFTPQVHVASDGTVGVSYYDLRNSTSTSPFLTDYWMVHCHGSCTNSSNWSETHVSGAFDMATAPNAGGYFLGDYEGLGNIGTAFMPFFARTTSSQSIATDIYAAKVGP